MKKVAENVFAVSGRGLLTVPVFVIANENNRLTLVETGLKKDIKIIAKKIEKKWGSLTNIERIMFTHRHFDHIGSLKPLLDLIQMSSSESNLLDNLEIIVHKDEKKPFIEESKDKKIIPNRVVEHNEIIDEELQIRAIHNPGHSMGHLCFLLEKQRLILLGDTLMIFFGHLRPVFRLAHDDFELYLQNLPLSLDYEWDYGIPAHFKLQKIPRERIEKFIEKRTK